METRVVNINREACDVLIDRSGRYGNQFVIGVDGNRFTVIDLHLKYWRRMLENPFTRERAVTALRHMKGKRLGCHCNPLPCHGDNYVTLIAEFCP